MKHIWNMLLFHLTWPPLGIVQGWCLGLWTSSQSLWSGGKWEEWKEWGIFITYYLLFVIYQGDAWAFELLNNFSYLEEWDKLSWTSSQSLILVGSDKSEEHISAKKKKEFCHLSISVYRCLFQKREECIRNELLFWGRRRWEFCEEMLSPRCWAGSVRGTSPHRRHAPSASTRTCPRGRGRFAASITLVWSEEGWLQVYRERVRSHLNVRHAPG